MLHARVHIALYVCMNMFDLYVEIFVNTLTAHVKSALRA